MPGYNLQDGQRPSLLPN